MKIKTTGDAMREQIRFSALFPQKASEQIRVERDGIPKLAPNGSHVHKTSLKALRLNENGQAVGEDRNVSLSIIDKTDIAGGKLYELVGDVFVTPYLNNHNRLAYSIIAQSVREVSSSAPRFNVGGQHNG